MNSSIDQLRGSDGSTKLAGCPVYVGSIMKSVSGLDSFNGKTM